MSWTTPKTWAVGDVLTAADMNTYVSGNDSAILPYGVTVQTWTPALTASTTNPTLGTGSSASGHFYRVGQLCTAYFFIKFGSAGVAAGSGLYRISVPLTASSVMGTPAFYRAGPVTFYDSSAPLIYDGAMYFVTTGAMEIAIHGRGTGQTDADPVVPAANDLFTGSVTYLLP